MTMIRNSAVIRCTPEEAFDFLSDHRSELEWNPACQEMAKLTDGPVGVGTRYRAKWKAGPRVELETMTFDRPREWSVHNGGPIELLFTCTAHRRVRADPARHFPAHLSAIPPELPAPREKEHELPQGDAGAAGQCEGGGLSPSDFRRRRLRRTFGPPLRPGRLAR